MKGSCLEAHKLKISDHQIPKRFIPSFIYQGTTHNYLLSHHNNNLQHSTYTTCIIVWHKMHTDTVNLLHYTVCTGIQYSLLVSERTNIRYYHAEPVQDTFKVLLVDLQATSTDYGTQTSESQSVAYS